MTKTICRYYSESKKKIYYGAVAQRGAAVQQAVGMRVRVPSVPLLSHSSNGKDRGFLIPKYRFNSCMRHLYKTASCRFNACHAHHSSPCRLMEKPDGSEPSNVRSIRAGDTMDLTKTAMQRLWGLFLDSITDSFIPCCSFLDMLLYWKTRKIRIIQNIFWIFGLTRQFHLRKREKSYLIWVSII